MVMAFLQSDYHLGGLPPESAAGAGFGARGELEPFGDIRPIS